MHIGKSALALAIAAACVAQVSSISSAAGTKHAALRASVPVHGKPPRFKYPAHAKPSTGSVLYDQSGAFDGGVPAQTFQSSASAYNAEAADDFVVTDAAGWSVSAFNFETLFVDANNNLGPPPPGAAYYVNVYADAAGLPGAPVCTYTGLAGSVDASNVDLSIELPSACVLPQGKYWLSLISVFDYPPQAFWANAAGAAIGSEGLWRNPNGGFGTTCSAWSDVSTCSNPLGIIGDGNPNYLFQVIGTVGSGTCTPSGICLTSTVGTDLSNGACASTDTIDATIGDQLNFCYTMTNNTGVELDYQTLVNNVDGTLFSEIHQPVAPGATFQFNRIATVGASNVYHSAWTAQDVPSGYLSEIESSGGNCGDRIFADGFENSAPACGGGSFVDITVTGTALGLSDDGIVDVTMPFSFDFYGTTANVVSISNNGGVLFDAPGSFLDYLNTSLPAGNIDAPALLPLWDDFDSETGNVYVDTRGATPNRQFIVEWSDRVHYDGLSNTDGATFELILNEDGTIQFEYEDVAYTAFGNTSGDPDDCTGGACATIGLQGDATHFNQFAAFATAVADHSGIRWTPTAPQIFTASDTVTVNAGAPQIVVTPSPIAGSVTAGSTTTIPLAIENDGDRDLDWTLGEAAASTAHFPPPGTRFAMPLGDPAKTSAAKAPHVRSSGKNASRHALHVPFANGAVTTFAADIYYDEIESFDATAPGIADIVASIPDHTAYVGGAFIGGDFSKMIAIAGDFPGTANPDDLFTIDTATGAPTLIGSATNPLSESYEGLAYDATSGKLYAASSDCATGSHLWTLDPATAAPTAVGAIAGAPCIVAIAVDARGLMYGLDIAEDALFAIDKSDGSAALIGSIGFNANYAQDMTFDQSTGILYLAGFDGDTQIDSIYTVDLVTGLASLVAPLAAPDGEVDAMAIETVNPCSQPQDLPWLSLSAISGTIAPLGSTPITATIDATGNAAGDTLSATVCAASNDPVHPLVPTPMTVDVVGAVVVPPTLDASFAPSTIAVGGTSTLTITLANANAAAATLAAPLTDSFPLGLVVAPTPNAATTCGGAVVGDPGDSAVTLAQAGSAIPATGSCTVSIDVTAASANTFVDTLPIGSLLTSEGQNTASATATLDVAGAPQPPTLAKAFNPSSVAPGGTSTLTITLANGNATAATLTAALTDAFPSGLIVAPAPNAASDCGGAVTADAGADSVSLDAAGSSIPAGGACTITVDVTAAAQNSYANSIPAGALQTDAGSNASSADATLDVAPPPPIPPTVDVALAPTSIAAGASSTLTLTFANAAGPSALP